MQSRLAPALCAFVCGCAGSAAPDAGPAPSDAAVDAGLESRDSGPPADGGEFDGGEFDAGEFDAGAGAGTWSEVQVVLRDNCSPCHDPGNSNNRTVVREYANLVGQLSGAFPLVVPSDVEASFLHAKVADETDAYCARQSRPTRDCGNLMPPPPRRQPLEAAEVELIRSWIEAGARED